MRHLLIPVLVLGLVVGCATVPRPTPLTQADVISMVKAGATEEDVMRRIDTTGTVFHLNADDVVRLRQEGVSDRLVTFMMDTLTRSALAEQRRREMFYYQQFHWGYGWRPHCR
jgi:hypothetical protein